MGVCDCREWHRMLVARQVSDAVQQLLDEPVVISKDQPLMTAGVSPTLAIQLTSRLESIFSLELPGGAKTCPTTPSRAKLSRLAECYLWKFQRPCRSTGVSRLGFPADPVYLEVVTLHAKY